MLELLSEVGVRQPLQEAKELMESAYNLRANVLRELLKRCTSVKTVRLCLQLGRASSLPWAQKLDPAELPTGSARPWVALRRRTAGTQAMNQIYLDMARLLTQVAPLIFQDGVFALKGGTAINLFVRDMPPGCGGQTNRFWTRQYASLYAWSSLGRSNYNAAQITLLRHMSHGLRMNLGYTFSKSIDLGSDTERTQFSSSTGTDAGSSFSAIVNSWNPRLNRAVSDFDVRHLLTADWVAELPVGHGKTLLSSVNRRVDGVVGGWSLAGITRWTSGLPFSIVSGAGWGTDWDEKSNMIQTGSIRTHTHLVSGAPQVFADPSSLLAHLRNPYPGEAGQRNNFRGDGYMNADASLSKRWNLGEVGALKFAWEVFNVSNSVRFDVNPLTSLQNMTTSGELGVYGATLTRPRVQQFSLRYSY